MKEETSHAKRSTAAEQRYGIPRPNPKQAEGASPVTQAAAIISEAARAEKKAALGPNTS